MSVFEPLTIRALLKVLEGTTSKQRDFERKWNAKVDNLVKRWTANRNTQTDLPEQLEWAAHVVAYVDYVYHATTVRAGSKKDPPILRLEVPLLGPLFLPPTFLNLRKRKPAYSITPTTTYLKPLHIVHPLYYPDLAKCPLCDSLDVSWQGWTGTGHRDVHGVDREETALGYQLQCNSCKESRTEARGASGGKQKNEELVRVATTNPKFWERRRDYDIPKGMPHFFSCTAVTERLRDLIIEMRPSTTSGGLAENIKQLHLLEYHRSRREYLVSFQNCKRADALVHPQLEEFSSPWDSEGYTSRSITDDLITDVYLEFSKRIRQPESEDHMRTLTAITLSLDNTYKIEKKTAIVDKNNKRIKLLKGGLIGALNQKGDTVSWRLCQSGSPAEMTEMMEGLARRHDILQIPRPIIAVADNCCTVANFLIAAMPGIEVVLDVWHFLMRYLVVVLNGTRNPFRSQIAKDIRDAILISTATKDKPAAYWPKEKQYEQLVAAYEKWDKVPGVWSAAAEKTHADQLIHVKKGCLTRSSQDVRSDGSRIEGSHKGWSGIMRAQPSGLKVTVALAHDHVLRRNIRNSSNSNQPDDLVQSAYGSHHIRFVSDLAELWNKLASEQSGNKPTPLPVLQIVASDETFGLVESKYTSLFKGLLEEVKDEMGDGEDIDLALLDEQMDPEDVGKMLRRLQIDPSQLDQPKSTSAVVLDAETSLPSASTVAASNHPSITADAAGTSAVALGKRKALDLVEDNGCVEIEMIDILEGSKEEQLAKRMRLEASTDGGTGLDAYFKVTQKPTDTLISMANQATPSHAPNAATTASTVDVFQLPVQPELSGLTPTQRLFSASTRIDARSLQIASDSEFILFMDMRQEEQWVGHSMTPHKYAEATRKYNARLEQLAKMDRSLTYVAKNPRALLDKLVSIEKQVLSRIATQNFKSKSTGSEAFWRKACSAVPLDKQKDKVEEVDLDTVPGSSSSKQRKAATCTRCRRLMYPGSTTSSLNHKRGSCEDGVMQKLARTPQNEDPPDAIMRAPTLSPPDWPQPSGLFTDRGKNGGGITFDPNLLISSMRDAYKAVIIDGNAPTLEQAALTSLLAKRSIETEGGAVLFKVYDVTNVPEAPHELVVERGNNKYIRIDLLPSRLPHP